MISIRKADRSDVPIAITRGVSSNIERFDTEIYKDYARLFRAHPFYQPPEVIGWLRGMIEQKSFKGIFQLDEPGDTAP